MAVGAVARNKRYQYAPGGCCVVGDFVADLTRIALLRYDRYEIGLPVYMHILES